MVKAQEVGVVVDILRNRVSANCGSLVAIDGLLGSGKSTLSEALSAALPAVHVSVDEFVAEDCGTYLAHVHNSELSARVHAELRVANVVLLDGICCAAVLDQLELLSDFRIYVARLDNSGEWSDGELFTRGLTEAQAIEQEEVLVAPLGRFSDLRREIIHYHFAFRPWERADVLYEHFDSAEFLQ